MEPLDDSQLDAMLRAWRAPGAPAHLRRRLGPPRERWWQWLLTGTIRVPVPVGLAAAVILMLWGYAQLPERSAPPAEPAPVSLADFQPVAELAPRVVGEP